MEKQSSKSKNKMLRLLPKAAKASVSFQNPPYSPGREKRANGSSQKLKSHLYRAFSGPIISMIPAEARDEPKSFEPREPTSPKISCMGQIKHKKKMCKLQPQPSLPPAPEQKKKPSRITRIFSGRRRLDDDSVNRGKPPLPDRAPSLSQVMRFASSRDTFRYFDWTAAAGEDWGSYSVEGDDEDAGFPMLASGGGDGGGLVLEPRKEINLWKRRTVAQLKPLQLNDC